MRISVVLFEDFELLDVTGPVEVFAKVEGLSVELLSADGGPVTSSQGVEIVAHADYNAMSGDVLLVPGGAGTRVLVNDQAFLAQLTDMSVRAGITASVCTGAALLAASGRLDGYRATTNKRAYDWATSFGGDVEWVRSARWVHDRDRWTSSGVSAGTDMALAFVAHHVGQSAADEVATILEWNAALDPTDDPFA
ncbi:Isonitrile hydratase [Corynebacterium glaucum]|uniref:Isonitrile hydratase n=1 Tax=Corynebacterium glaucum TaxID=187491 RepID=A0A1Q2HXA7_9CORY|nr:DJ-1/PfpI family protein [Corynebacterium glaucum]AQQ15472.1 Isonitrile hydratase [Corynebacterium glaucum]